LTILEKEGACISKLNRENWSHARNIWYFKEFDSFMDS
jgi:hypothetical protein